MEDRVDKSNIKNSVNPSFFFCIGSQKSGTTWLYNNLKQHPEIALPPRIKELRYFDEIEVGVKNNIKRLFSQHYLDVRWRKKLKLGIMQIIKFSNLTDNIWLIKYLMMKRSLSSIGEYKSRLEELRKKRSYVGDISPGYALLSEHIIKEIYANFPNLKVIFILRNPVEKEWSLIRRRMKRGIIKKSEIITDSFNRSNFEFDYIRTIKNWEKYYNPNQMYIGFLDELHLNQLSFLNSIIHFLDLTPFKEVPMNKEINVGMKMQIPIEINEFLYQKHEKLITELALFCNRFKTNYAERWEQKMHEVLRR